MKPEKYCPNCEEYRDTKPVEEDQTYTVRGRQITVRATSEVCNFCGEKVGTDEDDQKVLDMVHAEFRRQAGLLTPEEIKATRERYQLSQRSFAAILGMSEATINRYEHGALQDQAHDGLIRACAESSLMSEMAERCGGSLTEWQRKRFYDALAAETGQGSEVSERTGYRRFEYGRFAGAVLLLCKQLGEVSSTTINKLLFYVDFLNYKTSTVSLTGAQYRKLQYGPVPANYGELLERMEQEDLLVCEERECLNGHMGSYYKAGPAAQSLVVDFTSQERWLIQFVASSLGTLTAGAISARSHEEPAWKNTPLKQLISYQDAANLSLSLPE